MKTLFKTVALVSVFSVSEKFLGFLYRIFLSRTIGAEGVGLYQVALSVFGLFYTVACSGIPVTVSRLMTKYRAENKPIKSQRVITAGFFVTTLTALPITVLFFVFKSNFSFLFTDERCVNVFSVIIPGLTFTCIYSVLRGVFWGDKNFMPYSIIELLEEAVMIISGIILIHFAESPYSGAMRAGVAVFISYIFSFSTATVYFFIKKNKLKNPRTELKPLLKSAMPVTAMRTANTLTVSLVSVILPMRLVLAGYTNSQAMSAFGSVIGQAFPLLSVPTMAISAFTLVMMPEISEHYYKKDHIALKNAVEKALKITIIISVLAIPVFSVLGEEIGILVFDNHESGMYLSVSAFLILFIGISSVTTSILNSMGLENKTLVYYVISGILMLISIWILPKFLGIYSLLIGFTFVFGLTSLFNLILLSKSCKEKPKYLKFTFLSVLGVIPSIILSFMLKSLLLPLLGILLSCITVSVISTGFSVAFLFGLGVTEYRSVKNVISSIFKRKKSLKSETLKSRV